MIQVYFYKNIISQLLKRSESNNKIKTSNTHSTYEVVNRSLMCHQKNKY